jgi:diacylglycerol kinase (ATP)
LGSEKTWEVKRMDPPAGCGAASGVACITPLPSPPFHPDDHRDRVRVLLVDKQDAGDGLHTGQQLLALLARYGHEATYVSTDDDWKEAVRAADDVVLVAGGDGSVAKVARQLLGRSAALAALPLGTANNIAGHLGWVGSAEQIVAGLAAFRRRKLDIGEARGPWGVRRFVEGVGAGTFAKTIAFATSQDRTLLSPAADRKSRLARDLRLVESFVTQSAGREWEVTVDGARYEGPFLLLEVLNTRSVGPNVVLAEDADPFDGMLDVVMVTEGHRAELLESIRAFQNRNGSRPRLPHVRGREVTLYLASTRVHIDDAVWPEEDEPPTPAGAPFVVSLDTGRDSVTVLVPDSDHERQ